MRPRRSSARWLLLALVIVPGCLFKPIFHPPSATGGDAGVSDSGNRTNADASRDVSASDAGAAMDVPAVPADDCAGYYSQASGDYAPDAHHADGAICELPHASDGGEDVSSGTDAADVSAPDAIDATDDTAVTDAADDASKDAAVSDDAVDEATDAGSTDDATPADPDAGE